MIVSMLKKICKRLRYKLHYAAVFDACVMCFSFWILGVQQIFNGTSSEPTWSSFTLQQTSTLLLTEQDQTKTKLASYMLIRIGFGIILFFVVSFLLFHVYTKFRVKKIRIKKKHKNEKQTTEPVYQDIGDCVQIEPQQTFPTLSNNAERPILPPRILPGKPSKPRLSLTIKNPHIPESDIQQTEV